VASTSAAESSRCPHAIPWSFRHGGESATGSSVCACIFTSSAGRENAPTIAGCATKRWGLLSTIGSGFSQHRSARIHAPCRNRLSDFAIGYVRLHAGIHTIRSAPTRPTRADRTCSTTIYNTVPELSSGSHELMYRRSAETVFVIAKQRCQGQEHGNMLQLQHSFGDDRQIALPTARSYREPLAGFRLERPPATYSRQLVSYFPT